MPFPETLGQFSTQVFAILCVFCTGISVACLVRIILPSRKKSVKSKRFIFFCLFLSISLIFYTILIFYTENLLWFSEFQRNDSAYYKILAFVFSAGFLTSLFWKIFLPLFLVTYAACAFFTNHVMTSIFGRQNPVISVRMEENSENVPVSLIYCRLPDTLVLPVKRNWFYSGESLPNLHAEGSKIFGNPLTKAYIQRILLKNLNPPKKFSLPKSDVFPSLYSAHVSFEGGEIQCQISRDL